jgi:hypothetical protein
VPSLLLAALLSVLLLEVPIGAQGQDAAPATHLTSRGRFMVSGQISGVWSNDAASLYGSYNTWTVRANPSVVYFLRENLGLGASVSGGMARGDYYPTGSYKSSELGLACELVWNLPLGGRWAFMIRPSIGYAHAWSNMESAVVAEGLSLTVDVERKRNYVRLASSFPFVYALSNTIGLGIGPDFLFDVLFAETVEPHVVGGPSFGGEPPAPGSSLGLVTYAPGRTRAQLGASVALYVSF